MEPWVESEAVDVPRTGFVNLEPMRRGDQREREGLAREAVALLLSHPDRDCARSSNDADATHTRARGDLWVGIKAVEDEVPGGARAHVGALVLKRETHRKIARAEQAKTQR